MVKPYNMKPPAGAKPPDAIDMPLDRPPAGKAPPFTKGKKRRKPPFKARRGLVANAFPK